MSNDSYYTPRILAERLVSFIHKESLKTVADFCVGDGELIRAAQNRWVDIKCFGSDISADAISLTKKTHPNWILSQLDFLSPQLRAKSNFLTKNSSHDLILLNPPFSCRGGTIYKVEYKSEQYSVSTSMAFLVNALKYLKKEGILYAILPTSTAYSQKDSKLWNILEKEHNLSILEEINNQSFKGCSPNVILVSVNDFTQRSQYKPLTRISLELKNISVLRGKLSMDQPFENTGSLFLVHSTNLNNNKLNNLRLKPSLKILGIEGPAILLPRVGKPKSSKICVISEDESYILSDCIIAIKTGSYKDACLLFKYLVKNWEIVESLYKGTGAKYVTVEKISRLLNLDISNSIFAQPKAI